MDDGSGYFQNISLKNQKKKINIKSWHTMKNLQSLTKKKSLRSLKCVNPCHTTLGLHNIHVNFLKLQIT
jgi:hypothetical protein